MCAAVSTFNQNIEIYQLRQLVADLTTQIQTMREEMDWVLEQFECTCGESSTEMDTQDGQSESESETECESGSDSDSDPDDNFNSYYEQPPPSPLPDFDCETLLTMGGINND